MTSAADAICFGQPADASSAIALSLPELVGRSDRAVLCSSFAFRCDGASVAGSKRIETWTRVQQTADWLRDDFQEDEIEVLTFGGRVGDNGQKISGEAALTIRTESLLFFREESPHSHRVVGMAQGCSPLMVERKIRTVHRGAHLPHLLSPRNSQGRISSKKRAVKVLSDLPLSEARKLVQGVR